MGSALLVAGPGRIHWRYGRVHAHETGLSSPRIRRGAELVFC